jgi:WD40 repeat protein
MYEGHEDNGTWSLSASKTLPPRIAVGSNAHKVTVSKKINFKVYNLSTGNHSTIDAHKNNVPAVSFSPCGKFLASTSIDETLKLWNVENAGEGVTLRSAR